MTNRKEWKCDNCNKKTDKFSIIRVKKELFGIGRYEQFYPQLSIDLCKQCYRELFNYLYEIEQNKNDNSDYYD